MSNVSKRDLDNLSDFIWWSEGYIAGADAVSHDAEGPFSSARILSLRKIRTEIISLSGLKDFCDD